MPPLRPTERALLSLSYSSRQQFVCGTCRAHLIRQLHSSPRVLAEEPFLSRIKNTLFGSKDAKEKEQKREEAQKAEVAKAAAAQRDGQTTLRVKKKNGVKYQVAPIIDPKAPPRDYVPATTWEGLEHIGGKEYVKKVQDRGEVYQGFMPTQRAKLTDDQLSNLLHHITVEVFALQKAGRDLDQVCLTRSASRDDWGYSRDATIALGNNGEAILNFTSEEAESLILRAIPKQDSRRREEKKMGDRTATLLPANELAQFMVGELSQYSENNTSWMDVKLQDVNVKLAIVKRLLQLTGSRPSDFLLSSATTLQDLYSAFKIKEKPKKLAESEQLQSIKTEIPNVTVHPTRQTPIHKEKAVGRWKVIEEELMKRDLPVTGSRWREAKPVVAAEWVRQ